jgi:3-dehydroquinate dehydratase
MPNLSFLSKKRASDDMDLEIEEKSNETDEIINVERKVYSYKNFSREHPSETHNETDLFEFFRAFYLKLLRPGKNCMKKNIENRIPALKMIRTYRVKEYLLADILAGLAVFNYEFFHF